HEVSISVPPEPIHRILDSSFKSGHGFQLGRHLPVELIQDVTDSTPTADAVSSVWKGMGMKAKLVLLGCVMFACGALVASLASARPRQAVEHAPTVEQCRADRAYWR